MLSMRLLRHQIPHRCYGNGGQRGRTIKLEELASIISVHADEGNGELVHDAVRGRRAEPRQVPSRPLFASIFESFNVDVSTSVFPLSKKSENFKSDALDILRKASKGLASSYKDVKLVDDHYIPSQSHPPKETCPKPDNRITAAPKERLAHVPTSSIQRTFAEMRLSGWLLEALTAKNIIQPTAVQQKLIEAVTSDVERRAIYVRAQTGTGKSLGYIVALLAMLHKEKLVRSLPGRCDCLHLILVPNAILGQQLLRWIKSLVGGNAFWSEKLSTIVRAVLPTEVLDDNYPDKVTDPIGSSHILIATPGKAQELLAKGLLSVSGIKNIIVDEVDAQLRPLSTYATKKEIMNRTKHPIPAFVLMKEVFQLCREARHVPPKIIVASATLNRRCRLDLISVGVTGKYLVIDETKNLRDSFTGNGLTCPATIKHHYRMLKDADSIEELLRLVKKIVEGHGDETGVLFVPAAKSKTAIGDLLARLGIRIELISTLKTSQVPNLQRTLLIGSDLDARGWDMPSLSYVIVVDLPESPTHYLHMAGRVGRMGSTGTVYTMVAGEKDLERLTNTFSVLRINATPYMESA